MTGNKVSNIQLLSAGSLQTSNTQTVLSPQATKIPFALLSITVPGVSPVFFPGSAKAIQILSTSSPQAQKQPGTGLKALTLSAILSADAVQSILPSALESLEA